ncbi:membrane bound O-acyl transferase family-domain-containing protein [Cyathus striatus]|nr:membrane bound O-acyl transferase family-domain-containing protein [Cyathus striatus]
MANGDDRRLGLKLLNPAVYSIPLYCFFYLGLVSRSRVIRAFLFIPIFVISVYAWFYTTSGLDDNAIWSLIGQTFFMTSDAFLINDVSKLKRIGQKKDTNELEFWERSKRAVDFMFNYRQLGWTHEPRHILPPRPTESKWQFVRSRIFMCLRYFAICDAAQTLTWYIPVGDWQEHSTRGVGLRLLHTAIYAAAGWAGFAMVYTMAAIVFVGLNVSDVSEWPHAFGKWSDAYTVRRFWGRVWHQNLRRIVSAHGDFVAFRLLRLKKDTFIGTNVQRHIAFGISGIMHALGDYGSLRSTFWDHHSSMKFFVLQATAIMVEQEVEKMLGIKAGNPGVPEDISPGYGKTRSVTNYLLTGKWD